MNGNVLDYRKVLSKVEGEARLFVTFMNSLAKDMKPGEERKINVTPSELAYYERLQKKYELLQRWSKNDPRYRKVAS
ncbi:hypothetical protein [Heliorestis convoluta]|uniref:Uncharacterized protein n=1 Tax=Heliorestis convoluta TaxID=356322 RepID=A0A5Q2N317_9FIRM|nr:hypothetical protein [Heliorestis convoluta]QGG47682.1 hypothetical protein FTV88_1582 [Heliorestis convoluta]